MFDTVVLVNAIVLSLVLLLYNIFVIWFMWLLFPITYTYIWMYMRVLAVQWLRGYKLFFLKFTVQVW